MDLNSIYIIGEIGQAHDGNIALAHAYIDALAGAGVDAIKFQLHMAEAESSLHEPFRVPLPYRRETRMEYWKRMEFSMSEWLELKSHCEAVKVDFIVSPFSIQAVEMLEQIEVSAFKIGSAETDNLLMLTKIADCGKAIILSSGMSSLCELDVAIDYLRSRSCLISLMQCTSSYPTKPQQWGINMIAELTSRYRLPVGFSDHSGDIFACLAAASAGAKLLEFHIVFDKRMPGPDTSSSLTVDEATLMINGVRQIEVARHNPVDKCHNSEFESLKTIFGRSLAVNKSLSKGHRIAFGDLECKKPLGFGIPAKDFQALLGRTLTRDLTRWSFLTEDDLR
jgi:N,N'-diacetyllegionaminate synthase